MMRTGRLPREGDRVVVNGHALVTEQVVGRRIIRVRLTEDAPLSTSGMPG
jgi:CBS domain containing-hemolysin-like protein